MKTGSKLIKIFATLFVVFFVIACGAGIAACEVTDSVNPPDENATAEGGDKGASLSSISLDTSNAKTEYMVGESFSSTGLVVTASYSDSSTKTITGYTVDSSSFDGKNIGTYGIIVSYSENGSTVSASYNVTVSNVTVSEEEFSYQLIYALSSDGESYEVLGVKGEYDAVVIPAEHEGLPVTAIRSSAFEDTSITGVTIPDSVTSIGSYAFYDCRYLASVTVPDSVTTLGEQAFCNCYYLRRAVIGDSVASIGDYTFYNCRSLEEVVVGRSVGAIGSYAFCGCTSLKDADFSSCESLTAIGVQAFYNCSSVKNIEIPDTVDTMGEACFSRCSALESIALPFVGSEKNAASPSEISLFGYIFGTESYTGGMRVTQNYDSSHSATYCIPNALERVTVAGEKVMYGAFYGCSALTSITLEESVESVGDCAFYGCTSLTNLTIGENVESIGEYAFCNCSSLTAVTVPDSVESIGSGAFSGCRALESITLPFVGGSASATSAASSTLFGYIFGTSSYDGGTATKQYYASSSSTTYYIPSNLTDVTIAGGQILYGAFYNCVSLTSVTIGESVESIGNYAFYGCTSLTEIIYDAISASDLSSDNHAFYNAGKSGSGITVTIGSDVEKIPAYIFCPYSSASSHAPNITAVVFEGSRCMSVGESAFEGCTALSGVYISSINEWAKIDFGNEHANPLYYAGNLYLNDKLVTEVVLSDDATKIGSYAFYNYSRLTSVTIGESVESIGNYAFDYCTSLTEIIYDAISASDLSSDNHAFYNAGKSGSGITVTIGSDVEKIPAYIFCPCSSSSFAPNITAVVFEDGSRCMSVGRSAFEECTALTGVYISSIDEWAEMDFGNEYANPLYYAGKLYLNDKLVTEVVLSDDATKIGSYAFYNYSRLTSVTIGDNVSSIGNYAFRGCTALTSITISDGVTSIGSRAFYECTSLVSVSIGVSVTTIGDYAFRGCTSLKSVTIGDSVANIGDYAFYDCTSITEINYNATNMDDLSSDNRVFYNAGQSGSGITVTIGANVETIPAYIFCPYSSSYSHAPKITTVIFEDGSRFTSVGDYAFYWCSSLTAVYYSGTSIQWGLITIGSGNSYLTSATRYYYSATEPAEDGNWWHYDEYGEIVVWGKED